MIASTALRCRYEATVAGTDARGRTLRGLYLREPQDSRGPSMATVTITPKVHEDADNRLVSETGAAAPLGRVLMSGGMPVAPRGTGDTSMLAARRRCTSWLHIGCFCKACCGLCRAAPLCACPRPDMPDLIPQLHMCVFHASKPSCDEFGLQAAHML